jgi:hypothetical protein
MAHLADLNVLEFSQTVRPLGAIEQMFWLLDQHHPIHFAMVAHVSGATQVGDWRNALDRLQQRHPLMTVFIRGEEGAIPHFAQMTAPPIPMRIVYDDPLTRWRSEAETEMKTRFPLGKAPLIRAVLIHAERESILMLTAHHAIADGMALAYAIRDTLKAMSGEALQNLAYTPSEDELIPPSSITAALNEADAEGDGAAADTPAFVTGGQPRVLSLTLPPALTSRVRDLARKEGATVHCALLAALVIAGRKLSDRWRDIPIRVMSPVNSRSIVGGGEDCGVFVGSATSTVGVESAGFWDLARQSKAEIVPGQTLDGVARLISDVSGFLDTAPDVEAAANFGAVAFAREALLTNVGQLPFGSRYGRLKLNSVWGPVVLQGIENEQSIGVATVDGTLTLAHTAITPIDGLLEEMQVVLSEACARSPNN